MRNYVGITIGPICDTLGDARTPAALWFASSLFSDITRRICGAITGVDGFQEVKIYSPYYSESITMDDGIGKFHDRIIFSTSDFEREKMNKILETVKEETLQNFPKQAYLSGTKEFIKEYLQIHYVVKSEEEIGQTNCILALSPYLDMLELMKTFPKTSQGNPIMKLFLGETENGNKYIKQSPLFNKIKKEINQLKSKEGIWRIDEIASHRGRIIEDCKRKDYFAVVSADGDGIGELLKHLSNDMVTKFSEACLKYAQKAAALIGNYGGMTVYAGGDDLLFLAPVMTEEKTVFKLCNEIQELFQTEIKELEKVQKNIPIPTVSFGISIQYKKYPLYEALDSAQRLLKLAKKDGDLDKNKDCRKNNMMIEVQKHSGQSIPIIVSNESYNVFDEFINLDKMDEEIKNNEENILQSISYKLNTYRFLILVLNQKAKAKEMQPEEYQLIWRNFFDNIEQEKYKTYLDAIVKLYYNYFVIKEEKISVPKYDFSENYICQKEWEEQEDSEGQEESEEQKDPSLKTLIYLLKLKKFLAEKEGVKP